MQQKAKIIFMVGIAVLFGGLLSGGVVFARPDCAHPTLNIVNLGQYNEHTYDISKYCYYSYQMYHATCSTCGYDEVYHGESFYAVDHKWRKAFIEPKSTYTLTPQRFYCEYCGCGTLYEPVPLTNYNEKELE